MRSILENCYRYGKPDHRSNVCSEHRSMSLEEDVMDKGEGATEDKEDGEYNEAE